MRTLDLLAADASTANGETESSTAGLRISDDELHCQVEYTLGWLMLVIISLYEALILKCNWEESGIYTFMEIKIKALIWLLVFYLFESCFVV